MSLKGGFSLASEDVLILTPNVLHRPCAQTAYLVVDDDTGYAACCAAIWWRRDPSSARADAAAARARNANTSSYDLMVLDIMMPGETGLELMRALHAEGGIQKRLPVLLLTARGEASDRIEGFEGGADDYLMKPFEPRELVLRIDAILAAHPSLRQDCLSLPSAPGVTIPSATNCARARMSCALRAWKPGLMRLFAAEPGVALSREVLAEKSSR